MTAPPPGNFHSPPLQKPEYGQASGKQGDNLMSRLTSIGKEVGGVVMGLTKAGVNAVSKALDTQPKDWMVNGAVIQLVSKSTGRCLQILQAPDGRLFLDGSGGEGPQSYNAHFIVVMEPGNVILLHNNLNFIAIVNGMAIVQCVGPGNLAPPACKFQVRDPVLGGRFIVLESTMEKGRCLGVLPSGIIKSGLVTSVTDSDAQFAVRVIYNPKNPQRTI